MSEEEKGFKVKDRRLFSEDGDAREEADSPESEPREQAGREEAAEQSADQNMGSGPLPPVEFNGLILSLSHAAMIHLGQAPDPNTGQVSADLDLARHTIDTIALLHEKTQGNLTEDEQQLIDHALAELRMAFVKLAK